VDDQFDKMTDAYLNSFSKYDQEKDELSVTALFSWFRGDFGGKRGIRKILDDHDLLPTEETKTKFSEYDWTLDLGNFVDEK